MRLIGVICFIGGALAGAIPKDTIAKCATECHLPQNAKFVWQVGKSYVFSYKSKNSVIFAGEETQTSSIEGKIELQSIDRCNMILRMKDITIKEKMPIEEKEDFKEKLGLPVMIYHNDHDFKSICPSPEENPQSLNIKRSIIMSMANTMSKLDVPQEVEEYDTLGKCRTKYTIEESPDLVIKKERNLKTCTNSQTFNSDFQKKKLPLSFIFDDEYVECKQHIDGKIMKRTICKEVRKMNLPPKNQNSLLVFSAFLEIDLLDINPGKVFHQQLASREEIQLNLEDSHPRDGSEKKVEHILRNLCLKNMHKVDSNIHSDFMELVFYAKVLSYDELRRIFESLKNGKLCSSKKVKHLFVDTLPVIGTEDAVKFIARLIKDQDVTGLKANILLASFALVPNPTKDTVAVAVELLKNHLSPSMILGVTGMIRQLCILENCDMISSVAKVVTTFNEYLGPNCSSEDEKVLIALKAFGNMGYHGKTSRNIIECAKNCSKPNKVRLAAIESFRQITKKRPDEFLQIYSNMNEDHEIRIASFVSVLLHADEQQLQIIEEVAEMETNEQVASYVYTLQKSLQKTSYPSKQETRKFLLNLRIQQPNGNYWENSKHIEVSGYNKFIQIGGAIATDIIHNTNTKIPRSISTRFDIDIFNRNFNLLEIGIRGEKLEDMVSKFIELKQDIRKKKLRDVFGSKNLFGDTNIELSLFARTKSMEIFDLSTSDLVALKEAVNVAEVMNKVGEEKDFDSSHSFVFVNSELVVPSTTGRSYSIQLVGSSTVGLTAKSKVDLMPLPQSADVQLQFQPSVNVEMSTSVGMHSNYHQPEAKFVSRLHIESDFGASFQVKDGHAVLANLTLSSDDIIVGKMNTEMLRIDENNNAKPIFDKTQKKIDYCFRKLEKPLGVSACALIVVPKPLVVNSFPYIFPFVEAEVSLKKSDVFHSYEIQLEVPKNSSEVSKFKVSLDTPGSLVKRRLAANVEVTRRKGHEEFLVELTYPLKSITGSGSYIKNEISQQGTLELHLDSVQVFSSNFTSKLMSSRGRKSYGASSSLSYMGRSPTQIDGFIYITKGKRWNLIFDLKSNRPASRSFRLKGSFTAEGKPTLSRSSEWKMSSDVSLVSPFVDLKGGYKIFKQARSFSGNLGIHYQIIGMDKQAITFSGLCQTNSEKIYTNVSFQTTQYPVANWDLNCNFQQPSTENIKNDISFKFGNLEKNYIYINQNCVIPKSGQGQCRSFLEFPRLNVNSNLTLEYDIDLSKSHKLHVVADLCYEKNKLLKGLLDVQYESSLPLIANRKIEVEYPGRHFIYEEKITKISNNVIEGKATFQSEEGKKAELTYKIQMLNKDYVANIEIENSFPNKASLKLHRHYLNVTSNPISKYSIEANFKKSELIQISLNSSKFEGKIEALNEVFNKSINLDFKLNNGRHIKADAVAESGNKKRFQLQIFPNVESEPEKKVFISSDIDIVKCYNCRNHNKSSSQLVSINQSKSHDVSFSGRQIFYLMSSIENVPSISLSYIAELNDGLPKLFLNFSRNLVEKAKIKLGMRVLRNHDKRQEFSFKTLALSPDNSFENLSITLNHKISQSKSSTKTESLISLNKKAKLYKVEWDSDIHPHKLEIKGKILTPHENFKKQSIGLSFKQYGNGISSSLNIETPDDKLVSLVTDLQKKTHGYSAGCTLNSPFDIVKDVQAQITFDSHENDTEIEGYIDVNSARLCALQSSIVLLPEETNIEGNLRLMHLPNIDFEGFHLQYKHSKTYMSFLGKIDLIDCKDIIVNSEIKDENNKMSATVTIKTPYENLRDADVQISIIQLSSERILSIHIDANDKQIIDAEIKLITSSVSTKIRSRLKAIHLLEKVTFFKVENMPGLFLLSVRVLNQTSSITNELLVSDDLLSEANYKENTLFNFKMSVSENNLKMYGLKERGASPLMSVTFSIDRNVRNVHTSNLSICQESQNIKCYSVLAYLKNDRNSVNNSFYKNFRIELKTLIDNSFEQLVGGLHILSSADKYDFRSNIIFHLNGKLVGYDITLKRQRHENYLYSIDCKLYHPKQNCSVTSRFLHNSNRTLFEIEFTRDVNTPGSYYFIAIGREIKHQTKQISSFIKVVHPNMSEPLLLISEFEQVGVSVRGKLMIHQNTTRKNLVTAEIIPDFEQETTRYNLWKPKRKTLLFKLYSEEKIMDMSLMLTKQKSKLEHIVSYEWNVSLLEIHNKGAIIATIYRKSKTIQIAYFRPSAEATVSSNDSSRADLSFASRAKKIREISIKISGSCLYLDVLSSEPFIKSSFCVSKRRGNFRNLIDGHIYHHRQKFLNVLMDLDLKHPTFKVSLKWEKQDLCEALKELSGNIFNTCSIAEIKQQLKINLEFYKEEIFKPTMKELWIEWKHNSPDQYEALKNAITFPSAVLDPNIETSKNVKSYITQSIHPSITWNFIVQELLVPVIQAFKCSMQKNAQDLLKYLPDIAAIVLDAIGEHLQHCFKKLCRQDTICQRFIKTGHQNIKTFLHITLRKLLPKNVTKNIVEKIKSDNVLSFPKLGSTTFFNHKTIHSFGKSARKIIPTKAINAIYEIIKKIINRFNQDEDFNTAKNLISDVLKQMNKDFQIEVQQIRSVLRGHPKKFLQEQFLNLTYNPDKGELDFRILNPLK